MSNPAPPPPVVWIVMGVSGCGKSTVAQALSQAMGVKFADADDFHPPCSIDKMRRGEALTDADRWPWLDALSLWLAKESPCVLACSALRRVYRQRLAQHQPRTRFVHLAADFDTLRLRMETREHFMPAALLQSQFDTLEPPTADEALVLDAALPIDQLVAAAVADARR